MQRPVEKKQKDLILRGRGFYVVSNLPGMPDFFEADTAPAGGNMAMCVMPGSHGKFSCIAAVSQK